MPDGEEAILILTRRVGEALMIGEDVQVTVSGVKGQHVRIGIQAPSSISVHRLELYERIQAEQPSVNKPEQPS